MEEKNFTNEMQNIVLENREKLNISGVKDVLSFDDQIIIVQTTLGLLTIKGENLRRFAIMGEIEKYLKGKKINGLGRIAGGGFVLNFLTDEISSYEMTFLITSYD